MTTRELLETLNNTKTARAFELARNPPPPPPPPPLPEINWMERKMEKNKLMLKHLKNLMVCFGFLFVCLVLPVFVAFPDIGRSMLMGLPPMLFIAVSWMVGAWYAWDKDFYVFIALTLGVMPIRFVVGLFWSVFVIRIPQVDVLAYFIGMMIFWIAFTIPEFTMLIDFGNKLPRHGEQIES